MIVWTFRIPHYYSIKFSIFGILEGALIHHENHAKLRFPNAEVLQMALHGAEKCPSTQRHSLNSQTNTNTSRHLLSILFDFPDPHAAPSPIR